MTTGMDGVWASIKKTANDLAVRNQFISPATAVSIVTDIFRTHRVELPSAEEIEVLATELIALSHQQHLRRVP